MNSVMLKSVAMKHPGQSDEDLDPSELKVVRMTPLETVGPNP